MPQMGVIDRRLLILGKMCGFAVLYLETFVAIDKLV